MTAQLIALEQGTDAWHQHRKTHRNASETPAVLGISPFTTPYQLWTYKTGRAQCLENYAMQRGSQLEAKARSAYEDMTGWIMEPQVLVEGLYSASLDGLLLSGQCLLEIKCPMKGRDSETWQQVASGIVPEHYQWQIQHQLMVSSAQLAHLFVFDGEDGIMLEVSPDPAMWQRLHDAWEGFQVYLDTDTAPPLQNNDVLIRQDINWQQAAEQYQSAKQAQDQANEELATAKKRLIELCQVDCQKGYGVRVAKSATGARVTLYQESFPC